MLFLFFFSSPCYFKLFLSIIYIQRRFIISFVSEHLYYHYIIMHFMLLFYLRRHVSISVEIIHKHELGRQPKKSHYYCLTAQEGRGWACLRTGTAPQRLTRTGARGPYLPQ